MRKIKAKDFQPYRRFVYHWGAKVRVRAWEIEANRCITSAPVYSLFDCIHSFVRRKVQFFFFFLEFPLRLPRQVAFPRPVQLRLFIFQVGIYMYGDGKLYMQQQIQWHCFTHRNLNWITKKRRKKDTQSLRIIFIELNSFHAVRIIGLPSQPL